MNNIVGILGLGFVGTAINAFFPEAKTHDKYKGGPVFETILNTDILFLCLPTLFNPQTNTYDKTEIGTTLEKLADKRYAGIILIKSTVEPNYCQSINATYPALKIIHNPEFLTARTAIEDFAHQKHIILGYTVESQSVLPCIQQFYKTHFPQAVLSVVPATEAGLAKLACNSFYAVKVQFFTEIYCLCERLGISFESVRQLMLSNNWINPMHTIVPGPDGAISYGGACLPKDTEALRAFMALYSAPNKLLDATVLERQTMRN
jgi:UDPglucose 6-dehydrogenase